MSKSIKLTDNTFWDSSGVSHNRELLKTFLENKTIYDSGSNSNGSWIRYNDGTMICYGKRSFTVSNSTAVGSVFYTDTVYYGNFPQSFIDVPSCSLTTGSASLNPIEHNGLSKTSIGYGWLWNPTKRTNITAIIDFVAIGKWK